MIVFDLHCGLDHRFEGWFDNSAAFDRQLEAGWLVCPECGSTAIRKAPMSPAVSSKGDRVAAAPLRKDQNTGSGEPGPKGDVGNLPLPPKMAAAIRRLADLQAKALRTSTWVGTDFADKSRAMHYGETDDATIHGKATIEEAEALKDEGIAISPLLFPVAAPDELN
ncbi:MAG: DUF1178 family protein [Pontixanthobacter sp.]